MTACWRSDEVVAYFLVFIYVDDPRTTTNLQLCKNRLSQSIVHILRRLLMRKPYAVSSF